MSVRSVNSAPLVMSRINDAMISESSSTIGDHRAGAFLHICKIAGQCNLPVMKERKEGAGRPCTRVGRAPGDLTVPRRGGYSWPMADELAVGDPVTLTWYTPGEPWYPKGRIVEPAENDLARLRAEGHTDGGDRVLVHWATGNWRRWELRSELRRDDTAEA